MECPDRLSRPLPRPRITNPQPPGKRNHVNRAGAKNCCTAAMLREGSMDGLTCLTTTNIRSTSGIRGTHPCKSHGSCFEQQHVHPIFQTRRLCEARASVFVAAFSYLL